MPRIRVIVEYDSVETLAYERQAWLDGDVGVPEFAILQAPSSTATGDDYIAGDDTIKITFEEVAS